MIYLEPIGIINTPWTVRENMPIQPTGAEGIKGRITLYNNFTKGLKDLDEFSHIILIYHFDRQTRHNLAVIPFMDTESRGVFATRSPKRPNRLGMSIVRLDKVERNVLFVRDLDIMDNTPLLDIKPFIEDIDNRFNTRQGWAANKEFNSKLSDDRFSE